MSSFWDTPFLATGYKHADGILTIAFFLVILALIVDIIWIFIRAWQDQCWIRRGTRSRELVGSCCQVCFFIALALVALVLVNGMRFKFDADIQEMKDALKQNAKEFKRIVSKTVRSQIARLHDPPEDSALKDKAAILFHELSDELQKLMKMFAPHITFNKDTIIHGFLKRSMTELQRDGLRSATRFDSFKMGLATHRRFWWTQQWFMGYVSWATFVSIECISRDIPLSAVFSFSMIAYFFGLACAQSLFFALLLLKPRINRRIFAVPDPSLLIPCISLYAIILTWLPLALPEKLSGPKYIRFNIAQAYLILQIPLLMSTARTSFGLRTKGPGHLQQIKQWLIRIWFVTSVAAGILHLYTTFQAHRETDLEKGLVGYLLWLWSGSNNQTRVEGLKDTGSSIFSALRDHQWLSALGVDVLLSALAVGCWAVISSVDARNMIKCSIFPWRDEARHLVVKVVEHARDTTEEVCDDIRASDSMKRATRAFSNVKEEARGRTVSAIHGRPDLTNEDDDDSEYAQPTKSRRGRPSRTTQTSKRDSSRQTRSVSANSTRSKSRSRNSVSPVKGNGPSCPRRSLRLRGGSLARRGSGAEGDDGRKILSPAVEAVAGEAEAAGLSLGLFAVGGLGMVSSAVFGAENLKSDFDILWP